MKKKIIIVLNLLLALLAAGLFSIPVALSAFDPVNDDTDIFLANPNITAERPNVLIVLDNTANWNTPFTNEKSALVQVVNGLTNQFNVGLMMMVETGGGNDNVDGAYVRYHVRQMTDTNKVALSTMVNNLDILGDKGNNNTVGYALHEAFLYYAGRASRASYGKVKTDFTGNSANNPLAAPLVGHALPASPSAASLYNSPITDGCQKNFIIYISNGPANENAAARAELQGYLATLTGISPPNTIAISPNGQQGNWGDEMAKYMANTDVNTSVTGTQNVYTYTVEVNPGTTGQGPDMTALLRSVATNGKGKYFGVTDDASGASIVAALNAIFQEVQAVNSVFAATTLPVSVNVRGTNLNQVYIGVFRPDATKSPRWPGNLKMYNLALNSTTGDVFLADATNGAPPATGNPAQNSVTGFVTGSASSFWTADSTFWSFRDASVNGIGGPSDKPDGELVEKGGVAQQIRLAYATAEASSPARNLYTCTTGSYANCVANSQLANTPFSTANTDISALALALDTRLVSPLTGYVSQNVTALTDRKSASLNNGGGSSFSISSLNNGGTTVAVSTLNTNVSQSISTLTGNQAGTQNSGATGTITKSGTTCTATFSANLPSQFVVNATAGISGFTGSNQNSTIVTIASVPTAKSFTWSCTGGAAGGPTGTATIVTFPSTTARATFAAAHGFSNGQTVVVSGASPSQFNTPGGAGVTVVDSTTITYPISSASGAATTPGTASALSTTAKATTAVAHGLPVGTSTAVITGATPSGYNCTSGCTVTNTGANTFTYTVGSALTPATVLPNMIRGGSTTVTATTTVAHGFGVGATVNINGATPAGYNGSVTIVSVPTTTTFTYTTGSILSAASGTITVSSSNSSTVTATVTNHGFVVGDSIVVESVGNADAVHPGTYTVVSVVDANTITYSTGSALATPVGSFTVRPTSSKAYVTLAGHGYATSDQIKISGALPAGYNGVKTITVVDANTFTYPLSGALGAATSAAPVATASKASTTARATSTAHGFANGSSVQILNATPTDFNGTFTITVVDANTFTYTLATAQGDATGTISALQAGAGGRDNLIKWVRGEDNFEDENANGSSTDIRAYVHGDVLHSKPAVINYNRYGSDNDVYVFYGANDGIFRAIKGGYATDASASVQIAPGREAWGFIPVEFLDDLNRLRRNSPAVSSSFKKPYFADGSIGIYTKDNNNNGKLGDSGDKVNVYMSMRRGGRMIYALDVNDPHDPRFLWKIDNSTSGFSELGQTWSAPTVVSNVAGYPNPVLIFGAGYDPVIEDLDPATITASTSTTVTTGSGASAVTYTRSMGRGIYVVDALTGALLWRALGTGTASATTKIVSGMDYAIPSDIAIVKNETSGVTNRGYVGDTGGNLWRIDFRYDTTNGWSNTLVTQIASVGGSGAVKRKFLYPPDVVAARQLGYDALLIGSGDREHPFDTGATNRFYMFKDKGDDNGPVTGTTVADPTIAETAMFDATTNCIQDASACTGTGVQTSQTTAVASLNASNGWYITLGTGEKVVGNALALGGTVFFNTNQPSASAGGGTCGSNLGVARQYQVSATDATATKDLNSSGGITGSDRSSIFAGGGYLPPPVHVVVMLGGKPVEAVVSGISVTEPPSVPLQSRLRKFWFKEID